MQAIIPTPTNLTQAAAVITVLASALTDALKAFADAQNGPGPWLEKTKEDMLFSAKGVWGTVPMEDEVAGLTIGIQIIEALCGRLERTWKPDAD